MPGSEAEPASTALTQEQQNVAFHLEGHARVVAVAGAGKTTTLIHFIRNQLNRGVLPRRMLVLMYNKSAQQDFQRKLNQHMPGQAVPEVRTFHSLGWRIYQRLIQDGVLPAYRDRLLSEAEMDTQIWRMLQQLADADVRQDVLSQRKKWVEPAIAFIDRVKSGLDSPLEVFEAMELPPECRLFVALFELFEQWRKQQSRISYADMIYDPVRCFIEKPEVASRFGGHMQWILVDEYQDINAIQQHLIEIIHGGRGAVMVIGDPDQTIYEFRGSKPEYMVSGFERRFGQRLETDSKDGSGLQQPVHHYQLPHTFRYGHSLSLLANHLIQNNRERDAVLCLSHTSTPYTQVYSHQADSASEAKKVVALIRQAAKETELENIVVIHRLWALCAPIELELLRVGMPYQLHHSRSVLERQELQVFWLLLEVAAGEFSLRDSFKRREAWMLLLSTPYPKIKREVLEQLADQLAPTTERLGVALQQAIPNSLSRWQKQQLETRAEVLDSAEFHRRLPAQRLLLAYVEQTELEQGVEDSAFSRQQVEDRLQTIRAFIRFMASTGLPACEALGYLRDLQHQRLAQVHPSQEGRQKNQTLGGVQLTSIHKSKGLEWHTVIIPGLNGHYFPYQPEGEFASPPSEESERRLLYVAMTRARHQLHLIVPPEQISDSTGDTDINARDWPSSFEYELNLSNCQRVAKALEQSNHTVTHVGQPAEWLQSYCQMSGSLVQIKQREEEPRRKKQVLKNNTTTVNKTDKSGRNRLRPSTHQQKQRRNAEAVKVTRVKKESKRRKSQSSLETKDKRFGGKHQNGRLSVLDQTQKATKSLQRVHHQTLGEGRLVEDQQRYWVIHFDADESTRTLDKSMAEAMLTWLDKV